jgi:hypothetical protein
MIPWCYPSRSIRSRGRFQSRTSLATVETLVRLRIASSWSRPHTASDR